MDSSPALSAPPVAATETISATLRMFLRGLMAALGVWRAEPLLALVFYRRTSGAVRRIERMLVRFGAGRLWRLKQPKTAAVRQAPAQSGVVLPRRFGWLVQAGGHQAACVGGQLQAVLNTPEMIELLAASPQAGRILRPLCRALAVELPGTAPKAATEPGETKPRIRKPRVKPEPFRIPLPRGALTWARRDKALEKAIKLRNAKVLKIAK